MTYAFSNGTNDECGTERTSASNMDVNFFTFHAGSTLSGIELGDIIKFGEEDGSAGHVGIVTAFSYRMDDWTITHIDHDGAHITTATLAQVSYDKGDPTGYWTKNDNIPTATYIFSTSLSGTSYLYIGKDASGNYVQRTLGTYTPYAGPYASTDTAPVNPQQSQPFQFWKINGVRSYAADQHILANTPNITKTYWARYRRDITIDQTYTIGSVTVLDINENDILTVNPGSKILVQGVLNIEGISSLHVPLAPTSGTWQGIEFSNSQGSSIKYCDINYATMPILSSSSNPVIQNTTIGNSSFYDGSHNAAMAFYNSSPTISYVTVNGQSNSWNGARFAQGSSGSITNSTIQSCGAGNGIVVEGNSTPTISNNTIQNNHYHGIVLGSNSTFPLINGNTVSSNGGTNYCGILFDNAHAVVKSNTITGSAAGIYAKNSSFPRSWSSPYFEHGDNVIQSNGNGMVVDNNSDPDFGYYDPEYYYGNCNQIYSNTSYDVYATNNCYVSVQGNYWIYSPPTRFLTAGGSYIDFDCYLTSADCGSSICGEGFMTAPGGSLSTGVSLSSARRALVTSDFQTAESQYASIISESTSDLERVRALHGLYQMFLSTKSPDLIQQVAGYKSENSAIASISKELEIYMNAGIGDYDKVKSLADDLRSGEIAPELDQRILTQLAWLGGHSEKERETSAKALAELKEKYGKSVDEGLLAAIGSPALDPMIASESTESCGQLSLASYPNPFNPSTEIRYQLQGLSKVSLKIFDVLGREISTLVNSDQGAGFHTIPFDGSRLASGLYFVRISVTPLEGNNQFGTLVETLRMLLTK